MTIFTKRYHPPGTVPGSLIARGEPLLPVSLEFFCYDGDHLTERQGLSPAACRALMQPDRTTWIHLQGSAEPGIMAELAAAFPLHELALEDVLNSGQRPKAEIYDSQFFVILSRPRLTEEGVVIDQFNAFLLKGLVITFYEGPQDPMEPIRKRLRLANSGIRALGADYLFYSLVDLVIDEGFPLLESMGEQIEELEEELLEEPDRDTLNEIHRLKRELLVLRRMLWPHREVLNALMREERTLIQPETKIYLRDCYDHTVHIMELLEAYRDMTASMLDVYLSSASNRLNEHMRLLTVIATVFMPLTFIAGVYGMNFDRQSPWNMPELGWTYGYPVIWGVMIAVGVGMVVYFRRRNWL